MGSNYKELLNERLKDDGFKKEYEAQTPEYKAVRKELETENTTNVKKKGR